MSTLVTGIGELVTNDPSLGDGPLGIVERAALVVDDGRVVWVGNTTDAPDADGRVVVSDGQHVLGDVGRLLAAAIEPLWEGA